MAFWKEAQFAATNAGHEDDSFDKSLNRESNERVKIQRWLTEENKTKQIQLGDRF